MEKKKEQEKKIKQNVQKTEFTANKIQWIKGQQQIFVGYIYFYVHIIYMCIDQ